MRVARAWIFRFEMKFVRRVQIDWYIAYSHLRSGKVWRSGKVEPSKNKIESSNEHKLVLIIYNMQSKCIWSWNRSRYLCVHCRESIKHRHTSDVRSSVGVFLAPARAANRANYTFCLHEKPTLDTLYLHTSKYRKTNRKNCGSLSSECRCRTSNTAKWNATSTPRWWRQRLITSTHAQPTQPTEWNWCIVSMCRCELRLYCQCISTQFHCSSCRLVLMRVT